MTLAPDSLQLVERLGLKPHPEGGYYRETYRSQRGASTAIYFLLPEGERSRLHRLQSDELWHFYLGGPLNIVQLSPDGRVSEVLLGSDIATGQTLQHLVPAGTWFGAYPAAGSGWSLAGCTVAPAFEFADFELGRREELLRLYPHARREIELLTD